MKRKWVRANICTIQNASGTTVYSAAYDADGDMASRNGYPITWTVVDNLPKSIASAQGTSTFDYGPDGSRYYQSATFNGITTDTTYIGGLFEVVSTTTTTEYRHNIVADGQVIAVHTIDQSGAATTDYLHYDHLGSVDTITDDQGNVIQTMSFDAFGLRRDAANWDYDLTTTQITALKDDTDRGYTFQEQLDNVGLIHMNGRVYDPTSGRFISADPTVPDPLYSQSFNRYAYMYNNPLAGTDPTGYCGNEWYEVVCQITSTISNAVSSPVNTITEGIGHIGQEVWNYAPEIVAVVAAYYSGGAASGLFGSSFWGAVGTGAVAGGTFAATDTTLNGGNGTQIFDNGLRGAGIGAVGGELLYGANAITSYSGGNFAVGFVSHGVAGGLTSEAAGGNFNSGFELGGLAYTAYWGYQQIVNGEAPSWNPGRGTQPKGTYFPASQETQNFNNFGNGVPPGGTICFTCEGSTFSDVMDTYPGMNALATLHDVLGDLFVDDVYGSFPLWYNLGTMLPAAAFTYSALLNTTIGYGIVAGRDADSGGP